MKDGICHLQSMEHGYFMNKKGYAVSTPIGGKYLHELEDQICYLQDDVGKWHFHGLENEECYLWKVGSAFWGPE